MQVTTYNRNFEESITALCWIHSGSPYEQYLLKNSQNTFKICAHAFYLLRMLREMCIDGEYSSNVISDTIAPIFKHDLPSEETDEKMVEEIKKQIGIIRFIGLKDQDYRKKRV